MAPKNNNRKEKVLRSNIAKPKRGYEMVMRGDQRKKKTFFGTLGEHKLATTIAICAVVVIGGVAFYVCSTGANQNAVTSDPATQSVATVSSESLASSQSTSSTTSSKNSMSIAEYNSVCDDLLYLVNADNPLTKDYKVTTKNYYDYEVDTRIYNNLTKLLNDAYKDGIDLAITSAYRSKEYQNTLFQQEVEEYKSQGLSETEAHTQAKKSVLPPNASEHQIGLAVDFNEQDSYVLDSSFKDTHAYKWLQKNAAKYGFIERYPKGKSNITKVIFEPWHYRYVGIENAKKIKSSGLCLEEYINKKLIPELIKKRNAKTASSKSSSSKK